MKLNRKFREHLQKALHAGPHPINEVYNLLLRYPKTLLDEVTINSIKDPKGAALKVETISGTGFAVSHYREATSSVPCIYQLEFYAHFKRPCFFALRELATDGRGVEVSVYDIDTRSRYRFGIVTTGALKKHVVTSDLLGELETMAKRHSYDNYGFRRLELDHPRSVWTTMSDVYNNDMFKLMFEQYLISEDQESKVIQALHR